MGVQVRIPARQRGGVGRGVGGVKEHARDERGVVERAVQPGELGRLGKAPGQRRAGGVLRQPELEAVVVARAVERELVQHADFLQHRRGRLRKTQVEHLAAVELGMFDLAHHVHGVRALAHQDVGAVAAGADRVAQHDLVAAGGAGKHGGVVAVAAHQQAGAGAGHQAVVAGTGIPALFLGQQLAAERHAVGGPPKRLVRGRQGDVGQHAGAQAGIGRGRIEPRDVAGQLAAGRLAVERVAQQGRDVVGVAEFHQAVARFGLGQEAAGVLLAGEQLVGPEAQPVQVGRAVERSVVQQRQRFQARGVGGGKAQLRDVGVELGRDDGLGRAQQHGVVGAAHRAVGLQREAPLAGVGAAALQHVVARPGHQDVVAGAGKQDVVAVAAVEIIVAAGRAQDVAAAVAIQGVMVHADGQRDVLGGGVADQEVLAGPALHPRRAHDGGKVDMVDFQADPGQGAGVDHQRNLGTDVDRGGGASTGGQRAGAQPGGHVQRAGLLRGVARDQQPGVGDRAVAAQAQRAVLLQLAGVLGGQELPRLRFHGAAGGAGHRVVLDAADQVEGGGGAAQQRGRTGRLEAHAHRHADGERAAHAVAVGGNAERDVGQRRVRGVLVFIAQAGHDRHRDGARGQAGAGVDPVRRDDRDAIDGRRLAADHCQHQRRRGGVAVAGGVRKHPARHVDGDGAGAGRGQRGGIGRAVAAEVGQRAAHHVNGGQVDHARIAEGKRERGVLAGHQHGSAAGDGDRGRHRIDQVRRRLGGAHVAGGVGHAHHQGAAGIGGQHQAGQSPGQAVDAGQQPGLAAIDRDLHHVAGSQRRAQRAAQRLARIIGDQLAGDAGRAGETDRAADGGRRRHRVDLQRRQAARDAAVARQVGIPGNGNRGGTGRHPGRRREGGRVHARIGRGRQRTEHAAGHRHVGGVEPARHVGERERDDGRFHPVGHRHIAGDDHGGHGLVERPRRDAFRTVVAERIDHAHPQHAAAGQGMVERPGGAVDGGRQPGGAIVERHLHRLARVKRQRQGAADGLRRHRGDQVGIADARVAGEHGAAHRGADGRQGIDGHGRAGGAAAAVAGNVRVDGGRHDDGGHAAGQAGGRREDRRVHQRVGGGGQAGQRAVGHADIVRAEAERRFAEGEGDDGRVAGLERGAAASNDQRRRLAVHGQTRQRAAHAGVAGGVHVTAGRQGHDHGTGIARIGREDGAVHVRIGGRGKAGEHAAGHRQAGRIEVLRRFAEGEGDGGALARQQYRVGAGDGNRGRHGVDRVGRDLGRAEVAGRIGHAHHQVAAGGQGLAGQGPAQAVDGGHAEGLAAVERHLHLVACRQRRVQGAGQRLLRIVGDQVARRAAVVGELHPAADHRDGRHGVDLQRGDDAAGAAVAGRIRITARHGHGGGAGRHPGVGGKGGRVHARIGGGRHRAQHAAGDGHVGGREAGGRLGERERDDGRGHAVGHRHIAADDHRGRALVERIVVGALDAVVAEGVGHPHPQHAAARQRMGQRPAGAVDGGDFPRGAVVERHFHVFAGAQRQRQRAGDGLGCHRRHQVAIAEAGIGREIGEAERRRRRRQGVDRDGGTAGPGAVVAGQVGVDRRRHADGGRGAGHAGSRREDGRVHQRRGGGGKARQHAVGHADIVHREADRRFAEREGDERRFARLELGHAAGDRQAGRQGVDRNGGQHAARARIAGRIGIAARRQRHAGRAGKAAGRREHGGIDGGVGGDGQAGDAAAAHRQAGGRKALRHFGEGEGQIGALAGQQHRGVAGDDHRRRRGVERIARPPYRAVVAGGVVDAHLQVAVAAQQHGQLQRPAVVAHRRGGGNPELAAVERHFHRLAGRQVGGQRAGDGLQRIIGDQVAVADAGVIGERRRRAHGGGRHRAVAERRHGSRRARVAGGVREAARHADGGNAVGHALVGREDGRVRQRVDGRAEAAQHAAGDGNVTGVETDRRLAEAEADHGLLTHPQRGAVAGDQQYRRRGIHGNRRRAGAAARVAGTVRVQAGRQRHAGAGAAQAGRRRELGGVHARVARHGQVGHGAVDGHQVGRVKAERHLAEGKGQGGGLAGSQAGRVAGDGHGGRRQVELVRGRKYRSGVAGHVRHPHLHGAACAAIIGQQLRRQHPLRGAGGDRRQPAGAAVGAADAIVGREHHAGAARGGRHRVDGNCRAAGAGADIAGRIGQHAGRHADHAVAGSQAGIGREGGGVHQRVGGGGKIGEAAVSGRDVGLRETDRRLGKAKRDGGRVACLEAVGAGADGQQRRLGVDADRWCAAARAQVAGHVGVQAVGQGDACCAGQARQRREHHRVHERVGGGREAAQGAAAGHQVADGEAGRRFAEGQADHGRLAGAQAGGAAGDGDRGRDDVELVGAGSDGAVVAGAIGHAHLHAAGAGRQRLSRQQPSVAARGGDGALPGGAVVERYFHHVAGGQCAAERAGDILRGRVGDEIGGAGATVDREHHAGAGEHGRQGVEGNGRTGAGRAAVAGQVGVRAWRQVDLGRAGGHVGVRREHRRVHQRVAGLHQAGQRTAGHADVTDGEDGRRFAEGERDQRRGSAVEHGGAGVGGDGHRGGHRVDGDRLQRAAHAEIAEAIGIRLVRNRDVGRTLAGAGRRREDGRVDQWIGGNAEPGQGAAADQDVAEREAYRRAAELEGDVGDLACLERAHVAGDGHAGRHRGIGDRRDAGALAAVAGSILVGAGCDRDIGHACGLPGDRGQHRRVHERVGGGGETGERAAAGHDARGAETYGHFAEGKRDDGRIGAVEALLGAADLQRGRRLVERVGKAGNGAVVAGGIGHAHLHLLVGARQQRLAGQRPGAGAHGGRGALPGGAVIERHFHRFANGQVGAQRAADGLRGHVGDAVAAGAAVGGEDGRAGNSERRLGIDGNRRQAGAGAGIAGMVKVTAGIDAHHAAAAVDAGSWGEHDRVDQRVGGGGKAAQGAAAGGQAGDREAHRRVAEGDGHDGRLAGLERAGAAADAGRGRRGVERIGLGIDRAVVAGAVGHAHLQHIVAGQGLARQGPGAARSDGGGPAGAVVERDFHHVARAQRGAQRAADGLGGRVGDQVARRAGVGRERHGADGNRGRQRIDGHRRRGWRRDRVAGRVGDGAGHQRKAGADVLDAGGGGEQGRVHQRIGGDGQPAQRAAAGADRAGVKAERQFAERERDQRHVAGLERSAAAGNRQRGRQRVDRHRQRHGAAAVVAESVSVRAGRHRYRRGGAGQAGGRRELGRVHQRIGGGGKAAQHAVADSHIGLREAAGRGAEGKRDQGAFARGQRAVVAGDDQRRHGSVDRDSRRHAGLAAVAGRIDVAARIDGHAGGGAGLARCGREHARVHQGVGGGGQAGDGAARHGQRGRREVGGRFAEGERQVGALAHAQRGRVAGDHHRGGRGVEHVRGAEGGTVVAGRIGHAHLHGAAAGQRYAGQAPAGAAGGGGGVDPGRAIVERNLHRLVAGQRGAQGAADGLRSDVGDQVAVADARIGRERDAGGGQDRRHGVDADGRAGARHAGVAGRVGVRAAGHGDRHRTGRHAAVGRELGGVHQRIGGGRQVRQHAVGDGHVAGHEADRRFAEGKRDGGAVAQLERAQVAADGHDGRHRVERDHGRQAAAALQAEAVGITAARDRDRRRPGDVGARREQGRVNTVALVDQVADGAAAGHDVGGGKAERRAAEGKGQVGRLAGVEEGAVAGDHHRRSQRDRHAQRRRRRARIAGNVGIGAGRQLDAAEQAAEAAVRGEVHREHARVGRGLQVRDGAVDAAEAGQRQAVRDFAERRRDGRALAGAHHADAAAEGRGRSRHVQHVRRALDRAGIAGCIDHAHLQDVAAGERDAGHAPGIAADAGAGRGPGTAVVERHFHVLVGGQAGGERAAHGLLGNAGDQVGAAGAAHARARQGLAGQLERGAARAGGGRGPGGAVVERHLHPVAGLQRTAERARDGLRGHVGDQVRIADAAIVGKRHRQRGGRTGHGSLDRGARVVDHHVAVADGDRQRGAAALAGKRLVHQRLQCGLGRARRCRRVAVGQAAVGGDEARCTGRGRREIPLAVGAGADGERDDDRAAHVGVADDHVAERAHGAAGRHHLAGRRAGHQGRVVDRRGADHGAGVDGAGQAAGVGGRQRERGVDVGAHHDLVVGGREGQRPQLGRQRRRRRGAQHVAAGTAGEPGAGQHAVGGRVIDDQADGAAVDVGHGDVGERADGGVVADGGGADALVAGRQHIVAAAGRDQAVAVEQGRHGRHVGARQHHRERRGAGHVHVAGGGQRIAGAAFAAQGQLGDGDVVGRTHRAHQVGAGDGQRMGDGVIRGGRDRGQLHIADGNRIAGGILAAGAAGVPVQGGGQIEPGAVHGRPASVVEHAVQGQLVGPVEHDGKRRAAGGSHHGRRQRVAAALAGHGELGRIDVVAGVDAGGSDGEHAGAGVVRGGRDRGRNAGIGNGHVVDGDLEAQRIDDAHAEDALEIGIRTQVEQARFVDDQAHHRLAPAHGLEVGVQRIHGKHHVAQQVAHQVAAADLDAGEVEHAAAGAQVHVADRREQRAVDGQTVVVDGDAQHAGAIGVDDGDAAAVGALRIEVESAADDVVDADHAAGSQAGGGEQRDVGIGAEADGAVVGQQRVRIRLLGLGRDGAGGLDAAGVRLQHPVGAQQVAAGDVGRCGHVGAGAVGQGVDERRARLALRHVAAVQQQVAAVAQGRAPLLQRCRMGGQAGGVQHGVAEVQLAAGAVRDDLDAVQAFQALQGGRDLRHAIAFRRQLHHQYAVGRSGRQDRGVGDAGIDEEDRMVMTLAHFAAPNSYATGTIMGSFIKIAKFSCLPNGLSGAANACVR
uniref:Uncharacterized protein n=1 Tax=Tanacetum cinerariifolium TaxID=118510 RepID=A0A699GEM3_TANCI|nr:hypothetical protein [Tanacetum cinerariifolium]